MSPLVVGVIALLVGFWPQHSVQRPVTSSSWSRSGAEAIGDWRIAGQQPANLLLVLLPLLAIFLRSWSVATAGPLVVVILRREVRRRGARRAIARADRAVIEVVDHVALQLRSGQVLSVAVREAVDDQAGALEPGMLAVLDRVGAGETLERALSATGDVRLSAAATLVSSSFAVLERSGGPAIRAVDQLSETLRGRQAAQDELRSQASQAAASATALAALPAVFGGFVALLEPKVAAFYFLEPAGAACIVAAIALTLGGHEWIDSLIWGTR